MRKMTSVVLMLGLCCLFAVCVQMPAASVGKTQFKQATHALHVECSQSAYEVAQVSDALTYCECSRCFSPTQQSQDCTISSDRHMGMFRKTRAERANVASICTVNMKHMLRYGKPFRLYSLRC